MSAEQTVRLDGTTSITVGGNVAVSNFPATQAVSGTVTTVPSGTQTVSGTVVANVGTGTQPVSGTVTVANTSGTPLYTASGIPTGTNLYTTLIEAAPGVVAANNFLSIFNPAASGKTLTFYQFTCFPYATGTTSVAANMDVFRVTAASGGTLRAASDVGKFATSQPNSVTEVRTGNPTTTNANVPIIAVPPALTNAMQGTSSTADIVPPNGASFVCAPGEGVVARTSSGNVNQTWSLGFTWSES